MDLTTGLGFVAGIGVLVSLILMGGDLRQFYDIHAVIVILGGSAAATLFRFPPASILHGMPMGMKYVFTMRRMTQRDLIDELAGLADTARNQGPLGLEKVEVDAPFNIRP
jgi:chemotaxis protein MotA